MRAHTGVTIMMVGHFLEVDRDRLKGALRQDTWTVRLARWRKPSPWRGRLLAEGNPFIAVPGNASETHPALLEMGIVPDVVTDQTSAHDPLDGYVPGGMSYQEALELRKKDPSTYVKRSMESMKRHCQAMVEMQKRGAIVFDYGNNLRGQAKAAGFEEAFLSRICARYIRPCSAKAGARSGGLPFREILKTY